MALFTNLVPTQKAAYALVGLATVWGLAGKPGEEAIKDYFEERDQIAAMDKMTAASQKTLEAVGDIVGDVLNQGKGLTKPSCDKLTTSVQDFNDGANTLKSIIKSQQAREKIGTQEARDYLGKIEGMQATQRQEPLDKYIQACARAKANDYRP